MSAAAPERVALATILREWSRIGCVGFGGPPAHIALLRKLCVDERAWLTAAEFEDGIAAVNLLPGPASTQLAIYCAWRLRGVAGALLGGACFIVPGLLVILALATIFLAAHTPLALRGAAAGAGAAVAAVALQAAASLLPASWRRAVGAAGRRRWVAYLVAGGAAAALLGPYLVLVLAACGLVEVGVQRRSRPSMQGATLALALPPLMAAGGLAALAWVAFKVGALSYGGGFVIIPLMQRDAVHTYHWMSAAQFLDAVALGQITPGPVVQTVAVVGYAAAGIGGALLAADPFDRGSTTERSLVCLGCRRRYPVTAPHEASAPRRLASQVQCRDGRWRRRGRRSTRFRGCRGRSRHTRFWGSSSSFCNHEGHRSLPAAGREACPRK